MKKAIVTVLLVALVSTAATAGPVAGRMVGNVRVNLSLNKSAYELGDNVEITLSFTSQGTEASSFQFPTGQMYDLIVLGDGQRVWQWSRGRVFTQAFTTLALKSGESKVFNERWNQRDAQDRQVPSGEYEMVAVFPAQGGRIPSSLEGPRMRFRIGAETRVYKPGVTSRVLLVAGTSVGEVLLDSRPILRIRVPSGRVSAPERAAIVANRLRRFLDSGLKSEELTVARVGTEAAIMWRSRLVATADARHARLNHTTAYALAFQWRQSLVHALSIRQ